MIDFPNDIATRVEFDYIPVACPIDVICVENRVHFRLTPPFRTAIPHCNRPFISISLPDHPSIHRQESHLFVIHYQHRISQVLAVNSPIEVSAELVVCRVISVYSVFPVLVEPEVDLVFVDCRGEGGPFLGVCDEGPLVPLWESLAGGESEASEYIYNSVKRGNSWFKPIASHRRQGIQRKCVYSQVKSNSVMQAENLQFADHAEVGDQWEAFTELYFLDYSSSA